MWSKFTGVLIWKTQNPWTGLRGQFYDHLLDQTGGFYGCRSAAEPIHVQLNLATFFIEVVITTPKQLFDITVEVSVWDLEGTSPLYIGHEKLSASPKKTVPIAEMKYPKSKNAKPVYFLLLKLYNMSDHSILSRNFYWLYLPGGDYKLLEPYRSKKIPLKITSTTSTEGSTYEVHIQVENTSKKPNPKDKLQKNIFFHLVGHAGNFQKICKSLLWVKNGPKIVETGGTDEGVAFFLHFSVHVSKGDHKEGEDTRILPLHYSNYFSLVPGEMMKVKLKFEVPPGVTPTIKLDGWNF